MSLPKEMDLRGVLDACVSSSSKIVQFVPDNGNSFNNNANNYIRIPLRATSWFSGSQSYLSFTIRNPSVNDFFLDTCASAVINRIRITCGSVVITDVNYYNVLANLLLNTQGSPSFHKLMNTCSGMPLNFFPVTAAAPTITGTNQTGSQYVFGDGNNRIPANGEQNYILPLFIPFLNCGKYLPLHLLSAPLTLELYIDQNFTNAMKIPFAPGSTATSVVAGAQVGTAGLYYTVSNVKFNATLIDIHSSEVNDFMLTHLRKEGLKLQAQNYITYVSSPISLNGTNAVSISDKSQCVKSVITVITAPSTIASSSLQTYAYGIQNYGYKVGSSPVPSFSTFDNTQMMQLELQKCFTGSPMSLSFSTLIDYNIWNASYSQNVGLNGGNTTCTFNGILNVDVNPASRGIAAVAAVTGTRGAFAMAVDLESFSQNNSLESGINLLKNNLPITLTYTMAAGQALPAGSMILSFVHNESIIIINPDGTISVSI